MALVGPGQNVVVSTGSVLLYQMVALAGDQLGLCGMHYLVATTSGGGPTLGELVVGLDDVFAPLIKPLMASAAQYKGSVLRRILPRPLSGLAGSTGNAGLGGDVGELMPRQVSGVIGKITNNAGRSYRGRCYVPFPTEAQNQQGGVPSAAYVTALQALATELQDVQTIVGISVTTLRPVILHRDPPAIRDTTTDVLTCTARNKWGTQRRRGSFGRPNLSPV